MRKETRELLDGLRTIAPTLPGALPFGFVAGIAGANAGLTAPENIAHSLVIFAGAAQIAAMQLVANHAAFIVIVATGIAINLRFLMYSASLAPHLGRLALHERLIAGYLMTDQAYALSILRFVTTETAGTPMDDRAKFRFYLGGAIAMWLVWQSSVAAGIILGTRVPESWSLDFAVPLSFIALVIPGIRDRSTVFAALFGGGIALAARGLPFNLGLFAGGLCGIAVGYLHETYITMPREGRKG